MEFRPEVGDSLYSITDNTPGDYDSTNISIDTIGNFRSNIYYGVIISERDKDEIIVQPHENKIINFSRWALNPPNPLYYYYDQMLKNYPLHLTIWKLGASPVNTYCKQKYKIIHKGAPFAFLPYQVSYCYPWYFISDYTYNGIIRTSSDHLVIGNLHNSKNGYLFKGLKMLPKIPLRRL
jgi:hypothetical protein